MNKPIVAIIGCTTEDYRRFMQGAFDIKPEQGTEYIYITHKKLLIGQRFNKIIKLWPYAYTQELYEAVKSRLVTKE